MSIPTEKHVGTLIREYVNLFEIFDKLVRLELLQNLLTTKPYNTL